MRPLAALATTLLLAALIPSHAQAQRVVIGSKAFTESYVLGEIAKLAGEAEGLEVTHRQGMGGTIIVWQALRDGSISAYPEYTGTIAEEILRKTGLSYQQMQAELSVFGIQMTPELGFNNTYALAMRRDHAESLGITKISDLRDHPDLRVGITHEFLERTDGWRPLTDTYGLQMSDVRGIEHALGYAALSSGSIDIKEIYSTDAKIGTDDLLVLDDDLGYFPEYMAVFLYRTDAPPQFIEVLNRLGGTIDEGRMVQLNAFAELTTDYAAAAEAHFNTREMPTLEAADLEPGIIQARGVDYGNILRHTKDHLILVGISMLLAILIGLPLGIIASKPGAISQLVLGVTGIIQTVPALALLALMISLPFLGTDARTAIVALFLYSLLPIVRNTASAIQSVPKGIRESAEAMGLTSGQRLRSVYLPMGSRTILAGIKTSAVINVGTATLAALIGAGGLGEPIISGLSLNNPNVIMQGAIPAALLAILVQLLFELLDRTLIPKGLQIEAKQTA